MQFATVRINPLEFNPVALGDRLKRPEPTRAMTCDQKVPRLSQTGSAEHARWSEGQSTWGRALQNDLVVAKTWNA
jgi:hypothetical protein